MKKDRYGHRPFEGPQTVAVLFDKPSTRTRISFAVGIAELGGNPLIMDLGTSQLGRGEPIEDTARVLDRLCSAIVWRTAGQERVEAMASASQVPVVNALTNEFHPCQVLADLLTVRERRGGLTGITLASLRRRGQQHGPLLPAGRRHRRDARADRDARGLHAAGLGGRRRRGGSRAETGGSVEVLTDPLAAASSADVLATDTWVSMGQDGKDARVAALTPYQLNANLVALAAPEAIVLHCLPAYRGLEISADVIDGPRSAVWDEAENRLHAQKALLHWLVSR